MKEAEDNIERQLYSIHNCFSLSQSSGGNQFELKATILDKRPSSLLSATSRSAAANNQFTTRKEENYSVIVFFFFYQVFSVSRTNAPSIL